MQPIRLLTFSTLFPQAARPNHGIFVENRLRHLLGSGEATSTVLAPVPWFPSGAARFGDWGVNARAPRAETRHGIRILHPRFPVIPKVGMSLAPWLLYRAMAPVVAGLLAEGQRFDAIDAHYVYPDGVAAGWLGRRFGLPVVITARGTDVNLIPRFAIPRRLIQGAIRDAAALVAVSAALKQALVEIGAPDDKVTVLRNGVETDLFRPPADRAAARAALGLSGPTLVSVGGLIERKGHHRTIEAMRQLPGFTLLIAGEGPERGRLSGLIAQHGLADRVRLLGPWPHRDLPALYGAADASVLASSREGWANVLLESMACGTPVVAADIWGNPEVVRAPEAGVIYRPNTAEGVADGVRRLFAALPDRAATRGYAEAFSWDATTAGQLALFRRVVGGYSRPQVA
ncbi:glycosyltransferase [Rhodopila globiformis]|uniref:Glycosyl transferase family 1 n=1 Tax=Rhodopila globiformis TaxID=1071 RepID=A0A2S6NN93_RHOGL|nr:glycosyltransferase [Rhodopila globiformis]PPQ38463.1 glycosyl transferase family 1 [Rhodopila globiformis]